MARVRALLPLLVAVAAALPCRAQDVTRPRHNGSYVADDVPPVPGMVAEARKAASSGEATATANRLDDLLRSDARGLVPVRERLLYVSPRRWAQIQLLSETEPFGPEVLKAWRGVRDAEANAALRGAILSGDEDELRRLLDRYPAATEAPAALMALADRTFQRGDPDEAYGYLLRVPEHLAPSEEAAVLESDAYRRRLEYMSKRRPRPPIGWPTLGGDMTRARNGDPLPSPEDLRQLWAAPVLEREPWSLRDRELDQTREYSPVLPFDPVCDDRYVYIHLGPAVVALERATGKLAFYAPEGAVPEELFEWHVDGLQARNPGPRAVTVCDGMIYFDRPLFAGVRPRSESALFAFDIRLRQTIWTVRLKGEGTKSSKLPVFFRGAPAVDGDRLYVYGGVRDVGDDGPAAKEEAHLFCLDRRTGAVLWRRFLGYGDTEAAPEFPPYSGLAPAVGRGVVVVVTGLGVAAALDARSGEILWLFRYDRKPSRELERLSDFSQEEMLHLESGWKREPPRIVGDSVYFAPFDSDEHFACWLRGTRVPGVGFDIEQWAKDRAEGHRHSLLEYVAGFADGRVYYVGRRDPRPALSVSYQAVVSHPIDRAVGFAYGLLPYSEREDAEAVPPELFGRPTIAGGILLVPTRNAVYRYDVGGPPRIAVRDGERLGEIPLLPPFLAPPPADPGSAVPPAAFGSVIAVEGILLTATTDRVICYGAAR